LGDGGGGGPNIDAHIELDDDQGVHTEMLADCERKAGGALLELLRSSCSTISPDPIAARGLFRSCLRLKLEAKVR